RLSRRGDHKKVPCITVRPAPATTAKTWRSVLGSWIERRHVGRDGDDVVVGQLGDHRPHQRRPGTFAIAGREQIELARDVYRRLAGDTRYVGEAPQRRAMADGAGDRLAVAAR